MTRFGSPMAITVADAGSEAETQQVRAKMLLWPLDDPDLALGGFSQLVWFSTLKTSARNWSLSRKPTDCRLRVRLCDQYRNVSVSVQRYRFPGD